MDQTTEQTAQPEVTQTTTSLTTEQPQEARKSSIKGRCKH